MSCKPKSDREMIPVTSNGAILYFLDSVTLKKIERPSTEPEIEQDLASIIDGLVEYSERKKIFSRCYFVGGDHGAIKIGHSINVYSRLAAIQSHSPIPVKILAHVAGGAVVEAAYHTHFQSIRLHGEWFERTPEILAEIERLNNIESNGQQDQSND